MEELFMRVLSAVEAEEVSGGILPVLVVVAAVAAGAAVASYFSEDDEPASCRR